nr:Cof-type HAD-IIB family hydrolase [uncultured Bacillus sp.]
MNKIVFFDIDGTLLGHENKLPHSAKEAIWQLQKKGIYVAIATGRGPFMFELLREELGIETFVSFNGQYVVFEGEVIRRNPIRKQDLNALYRNAAIHQHPLVFMNEETMKSNVDYHVFIERGMSSLSLPMPEKNEYFYHERDIYQALLFCEKTDEEPYIEELANLNFIRWHEFSTDVLPIGGSKAKGIQTIIQQLGFKMEDVYAFGDGLNDIEMLQTAGTAVAMGNAVQELKRHADYITTDVDEHGIWNGLKQLHLI